MKILILKSKTSDHWDSNPHMIHQNSVAVPYVLRKPWTNSSKNFQNVWRCRDSNPNLQPVGYLTKVTAHFCILEGANSQTFHELADFRGKY